MLRSFTQAIRLLAFALLALSITASAQVTTHTGTLDDGATFLIEVPANWNGTLFLYSHGYVTPGSANPAQDVGDPATRAFMLANGFALAGSSYATTGWAVHEALPDQIAVLDQFDALVAHPKRTIAWGHSLGGMITAGLIQLYPERFDAAMPMCGVLSGGVATWNTALDGEFAFKNLLAAETPLQMVKIANPNLNLGIAEQVLALAQATPQGRARIALVADLDDGPGWFVPTSPEPAANDFAGQEANQFLWAQQVDFPFIFAFRAELEARAGGNVSWNTHVDYRRQFERSINRAEVKALYGAAGLDLDADLDALNDAERVSASEEPLEYLERNIIYNGNIQVPVLTLHTTGDGLVVVENESAYDNVVDEAGNARLLQQRFVHRAGHCAFTPAETIAAVETLLTRLATGRWPHDSDADDLNAEAAGLGPLFNIFATSQGVVPTPPAFVDFHPAPYLRPFDAFDACHFGFDGDEHRCHERHEWFEAR
ncbi:MAG TPA: prolyl oligopeptidase family serine peptidase [Terriglobales bacterium]|nr:prolyl oligopeptidase family serine peptidase [Terriglobales bacterium]